MAKELAGQMTLVFPLDRELGKVWLARHKSEECPFIGKRSGYGGGIDDEKDRSPREAACRELFEESKVKSDVFDLEYLGAIFFHRKGRRKLCFVYALLKWEGEFQETDEMEKAEAFPLDALPFDEMTEGDREWLREALAGELVEKDLHVYHNDDWTLDRVEGKAEKVA
jgi:ADP-ribose pyrophosphatase YjhB (NUDIX family)